MEMMMKVLVLHDVMARHIPLDKRSFAVNDPDEWELYDNISSALDRLFASMSEDFTALMKEDEGIYGDKRYESCDVFDGRLYRFIFTVTVQHGLASSGHEILSDYFDFQPWVQSELEWAWEQTGAKTPFFPISMKDLVTLDGIEPPALPPKVEARGKASVKKLGDNFTFAKQLWRGQEFKTVIQDEEEIEDVANPLFTTHDWKKEGPRIDSLLEEETMEKNKLQKNMEEKNQEEGKDNCLGSRVHEEGYFENETACAQIVTSIC